MKDRLFFYFFAFLLFASSAFGCFAEEQCPVDKLFPSLGNCGYDVEKYVLRLRWESDEDLLFGDETITLRTLWEVEELRFDFGGRHVISVLELDGVPVDFRQIGEKLIISGSFQADARYTLHAVYNGAMPRGTVLTSADYEKDHRGESFLTMCEPDRAKEIIICNDHPRDKAFFDLFLTVPHEFTAASGGRLREVREFAGENGKEKEFHYEYAEPLAPYLLAFAAADFDVFSVTDPNGRVRMDFIDSALSVEDYRTAEELTGKVPEMLEFLEDMFGPYPFEDVGSIIGSPLMNAAAETQTRPTYDVRSLEETTFIHELAHQWIGNKVSLADWSDLWVKEGFAEFAAALWLKHTKGEEAFRERILEDYQAAVNSDLRPISSQMLWKIMSSFPASVPIDPVTAERLSVAFLRASLSEEQKYDLEEFLTSRSPSVSSFFSDLLPKWDGSLFLSRDALLRLNESIGPNPLDGYSSYVVPSVGPKGLVYASEEISFLWLYGAQTYQAGALVYYVIWKTVGEDAFKGGVNKLMSQYTKSGISAEDLFSVFSEVSAINIHDLVQPWLIYEGHAPDLLGIASYEEVRK